MASVRINLLPHREQKRQARQRQFISLAVSLAILGLAIVALVHGVLSAQIENQKDRNNLLKKEIAKLDEQIKEIDRLRDQIQAVLARKQVVETLQANRSEAVHLLDQLVRQLPDGIYLKSVKQVGTKVTVGGFTQLGLVEMTRKRTRESLARMLCEPCPTCEGRGQVKTARSVCYDIMREILREARQFAPKEFRVVAAANVVEMLLDEESQHLAGLSDFIGRPISLTAEPTNQTEHYDIVLL